MTWSALMAAAALHHPAAYHAAQAVLPPFPGAATALLSSASAVMAAWSGSRLAGRVSEVLGFRAMKSSVHIRSDVELPSPETWRNWDGMLLGYTVDSGEPVIVDYENWMRHCFIIGQSGVGKTVLGEWLIFQQIVRGGGVIFVDGKMDEDNLNKIHQMACWAGRRDDLLVINPGKPELSNTYNPILYGDPDEVASRIISLIPSAENNPGADYYRQQATQALTTLINGIQSIPANAALRHGKYGQYGGVRGMAYNFFDLAMILQNQRALESVLDRLGRSSDGAQQLLAWLEQFKNLTRDGVSSIDMKKMKDIFGGVGGRMHNFGTGNFGQVTSSYSPDVKLYEAIMDNKIVYVALPTMGKAEAASNFGKMFLGDYRTAVSWIQDTPVHLRPSPPTLCFFDEAGSYVTQAWSRVFEQARSARQALVPAVQTVANLEAVSKELKSMVMGNTWTKIIFKLGEKATIEEIAALIGKERYGINNVSYGETENATAQAASATKTSMGTGFGKNVTLREEEDYRVRPTTLAALPIGEALVLYGNSRLYHIRIPRLEFSPAFVEAVSPFEVNRMPQRHVEGLGIRHNLERYISD
ncbi:MAG: TraM recognition domain-containing protein [Rhodocyclaceae bacterium]|nr:TraM recognition domain-containing protein [Rhodocyclaceae bacterium]